MSEDYVCADSRSKKRDKFKRKKWFPYKHGGKFRTNEENPGNQRNIKNV